MGEESSTGRQAPRHRHHPNVTLCRITLPRTWHTCQLTFIRDTLPSSSRLETRATFTSARQMSFLYMATLEAFPIQALFQQLITSACSGSVLCQTDKTQRLCEATFQKLFPEHLIYTWFISLEWIPQVVKALTLKGCQYPSIQFKKKKKTRDNPSEIKPMRCYSDLAWLNITLQPNKDPRWLAEIRTTMCPKCWKQYQFSSRVKQKHINMQIENQ